MILMCIVVPMTQDEIRRCASAQALKPFFYLSAAVRKEAVLKGREVDRRRAGVGQECLRRSARFLVARSGRAKNRPVHIQVDSPLDPSEDRCACTDLDVVGMRPDAKQG